MAEAPKPGIYPGVSFDVYASWEAANHSVLKHYHKKTPAHARYEELNQQESTPFQALGHLIHLALLEPQRYEQESPMVAPKVDRRTKEGKASWAAFERQAQGHTIVMPEELACLENLRVAVRANASCRQALFDSPGKNELSIVWDDPDTGVRCKGRLDRVCEFNGWPMIVDLKTSSAPASTHLWEMAVERYSYHQQAAHYLRGLEILRPLPQEFRAAAGADSDGEVRRKFAWVVLETEPPYCVRMFEIDDAALEIGQDTLAASLSAYAQCRKAGVWPGWPQGIDLAGLPPWVLKRFNLE